MTELVAMPGRASDAKRPNLADRDHPFRLQGSGKIYTYKLFLEASHHLLRDGGRLGMLSHRASTPTRARPSYARPSSRVRVGVGYCFENRAQDLPDRLALQVRADRRRSAAARRGLNAAFMRHDVRSGSGRGARSSARGERYQAIRADTWSFMELKGDRDLELVDRIYADTRLLGDVARAARRLRTRRSST